MPITDRSPLFALAFLMCSLVCAPPAAAGDAPSWMHALTSAQLPAYDEKTDAALLYSEINVTVLSVDKMREHVRKAYKILRPEGREHGTVYVYFHRSRKITSLRGWCIPAQGRDYEVKDKDATDMSPPIEMANWCPTSESECCALLLLIRGISWATNTR